MAIIAGKRRDRSSQLRGHVARLGSRSCGGGLHDDGAAADAAADAGDLLDGDIWAPSASPARALVVEAAAGFAAARFWSMWR